MGAGVVGCFLYLFSADLGGTVEFYFERGIKSTLGMDEVLAN